MVTREASVPAVDPHRQPARFPGRRDKVRLAVPVEVDDSEPDDGRVGVKPSLVVSYRETYDDLGRVDTRTDAIVNSVAIQVGVEDLGGCRRRHECRSQREHDAEGGTRKTVHGLTIPCCHEFVEMIA